MTYWLVTDASHRSMDIALLRTIVGVPSQQSGGILALKMLIWTQMYEPVIEQIFEECPEVKAVLGPEAWHTKQKRALCKQPIQPWNFDKQVDEYVSALQPYTRDRPIGLCKAVISSYFMRHGLIESVWTGDGELMLFAECIVEMFAASPSSIQFEFFESQLDMDKPPLQNTCPHVCAYFMIRNKSYLGGMWESRCWRDLGFRMLKIATALENESEYISRYTDCIKTEVFELKDRGCCDRGCCYGVRIRSDILKFLHYTVHDQGGSWCVIARTFLTTLVEITDVIMYCRDLPSLLDLAAELIAAYTLRAASSTVANTEERRGLGGGCTGARATRRDRPSWLRG
jgi:hypothetical protein